jgi:hypothetical protein
MSLTVREGRHCEPFASNPAIRELPAPESTVDARSKRQPCELAARWVPGISPGMTPVESAP